MKKFLILLISLYFISNSAWGQENDHLSKRKRHHDSVDAFHIEVGAGAAQIAELFSLGGSIEPQYTFKNQVSIGLEFTHHAFETFGNNDQSRPNQPHKFNSYLISVQKLAKPFFVSLQTGVYHVYDVKYTGDEVISLGASIDAGLYVGAFKLGFEASFYKTYDTQWAMILRLRI